MPAWPPQPVIYEINTWTWLTSLSGRLGFPVTLGTVPGEEWDRIAAIGFNAVWLMGVWERSPAGRRVSLEDRSLLEEYERELPGFSRDDVSGSPYCIHRYVVDEHLGGPCGLQHARAELAARKLRLVLDYVPNHVAPDHPWTAEHPEYFIRGTERDLTESPSDFFRAGDNIIAHGKDPYFAPWPDTAQVDGFNPGLRKEAEATLQSIADCCDGVRCDMAMLLLNEVFARTWGARARTLPSDEYWSEVIAPVRARHPEFLFIAEVYWNMEAELQHLGFDYCYDKRFYDALAHGSADEVRAHLGSDLSYQQRLIRFLENHDEPRAASIFLPARERAAAVAMMTVPGARLVHEGQMEGSRIKLSVHLGRRPEESVNETIRASYERIFDLLRSSGLLTQKWQLCSQSGWPDNQSYRNLVSWTWRNDDQRNVVIVNFSDTRSQGRVQLPWADLQNRSWALKDLLSGQVFSRDGNELLDPGLFVDMEAWESYLFRIDEE